MTYRTYVSLLVCACAIGASAIGCVGAVDPAYSQVYERVPLDGDRVELRLVRRGLPHSKKELDEIHLRVGGELWYIRMSFAGKPLPLTSGKYSVTKVVDSAEVSNEPIDPVVIEQCCSLARMFSFEKGARD